MNRLGKYLSICLVVILAVSSLLIVKSTYAQTTPKPAVPEFNIKVVDNSYYVPATTPVYRTDPYTGERTITEEGHEGYTVQNGTVDLTIHTQKFTSYYDNNNNLIRLYFRIAYKGHFETSWNYYLPNDGYYGNDSQYLEASVDETSKVQLGFGHFSFVTGEYRSIANPPSLGEIAKGGQIDFKAEAFIGCANATQYVTLWGLRTFYTYIGESGGWSNVQTVSIPEGSITVSTSPNSTSAPSPTVPEFPAVLFLPLFVVLPLIMAMIQRKRPLSKSV
ncbi:MAG TPA: hypothetical protein VLH35_02725 [Candidatus Acidoferrales bacterium]|nr:hypothetical protein [Candidatus Acidoferrales bacterium]